MISRSTKGWLRSDVSRLCVVIEELVANLYEHGGLTGSDAIDLSLVSAPGRNYDRAVRSGPAL